MFSCNILYFSCVNARYFISTQNISQLERKIFDLNLKIIFYLFVSKLTDAKKFVGTMLRRFRERRTKKNIYEGIVGKTNNFRYRFHVPAVMNHNFPVGKCVCAKEHIYFLDS